MLLSPIPYVPSDKSESPKFRFCPLQPGTTSTRLVINAVFWMSGLFVALFTALSTPGLWGQGIGRIILSRFKEYRSLTLSGCLLVVVHGPVYID